MGNWAVSPTVFKPHPKRDVDGKSFFREDFVTARRLAKKNPHPNGVRIGHLTVVQLNELKLRAIPMPLKDEAPGHAIVPELRYVKTQSNDERQDAKRIQLKLAQFVTLNRVYTPKGLPDPVPTSPSATPQS
jgi:hypothetical protein